MYNEGVLTSLKNAVIPNTTHPKKSIRHIIVPEISPPQLCCDSAYKSKAINNTILGVFMLTLIFIIRLLYYASIIPCYNSLHKYIYRLKDPSTSNNCFINSLDLIETVSVSISPLYNCRIILL